MFFVRTSNFNRSLVRICRWVQNLEPAVQWTKRILSARVRGLGNRSQRHKTADWASAECGRRPAMNQIKNPHWDPEKKRNRRKISEEQPQGTSFRNDGRTPNSLPARQPAVRPALRLCITNESFFTPFEASCSALIDTDFLWSNSCAAHRDLRGSPAATLDTKSSANFADFLLRVFNIHRNSAVFHSAARKIADIFQKFSN